MRLYLDDVRSPKNPDDWHIVRSVAEAKALLEGTNELVSTMSLDHDLGETPDGKEEPTGLDFLRWIGETGRWPLNKPMVHSANPAGGQRMRDYIEDFGPYPKANF
jgi:hypothetical protein